MSHQIRNAANGKDEYFHSLGAGTAADPFVVGSVPVDENNNPLGRAANPMFVHTSPRLADSVGHKTYNMFGENPNTTVVAAGDDMWMGTATSIPFPNQSVGEQMVIKSGNAADVGIPFGNTTGAPSATALVHTGAGWQTRGAVATDIVINLTTGASGTISVVTDDSNITTSAMTGGDRDNLWATGDQYQILGGGTGCRWLDLHYLDGDSLEQIERVPLNGITGVNTVATDITFVNDTHTVEVGSAGVAVGDVIVHKLGAAATVYDMIAAGGNKSLSCILKVPAGKTYFIKGWTASVASGAANKPAAIRLRSTNYEDTLYPGVFLFKDTFYLESGGIPRKFDEALRIPQLAVVKISIWASSASSFASGSFEGVLVDNSLIV